MFKLILWNRGHDQVKRLGMRPHLQRANPVDLSIRNLHLPDFSQACRSDLIREPVSSGTASHRFPDALIPTQWASPQISRIESTVSRIVQPGFPREDARIEPGHAQRFPERLTKGCLPTDILDSGLKIRLRGHAPVAQKISVPDHAPSQKFRIKATIGAFSQTKNQAPDGQVVLHLGTFHASSIERGGHPTGFHLQIVRRLVGMRADGLPCHRQTCESRQKGRYPSRLQQCDGPHGKEG